MKKENQKLYKAIEYWQDKRKQYSKKSILYFLLFFSILTSLGYTVDSIIIKEEMTNIELVKYCIYFVLIILTLYILSQLLNIAMKNLHLKELSHQKETSILSYLSLKKNHAEIKNKKEAQEFENSLIKA